MDILTWVIIIGGIIVILFLIVGIIVSANSERAAVERRLDRYLEENRPVEGDKSAADRAFITDWVNRHVSRSSLGDRIARDLARADLKFKVAEYFALLFISTVGVAFISWLLGGHSFNPESAVSLIFGGMVGFFLPGFYVRRQQRQRLTRFNEQLPDMLNLMVNGLRAGYSTMQAMEAVSKELPPPISDEFRRVVQEMQLGITMETALENLLRRIPSDDLDFVITAINVQREVGGNLSEILDVISFTIRERIRIKGEIRVLTAQVRTSGTFMALIPVFLVVILWFMNREYMMTFFSHGVLCGAAALGLAAFLIVSGYFTMMRIADIEV